MKLPTSVDFVLEEVEHSIWITADWTDSCEDSWISGSQLDSSEDSSLYVFTVWKHDWKSCDRFFTSDLWNFNTACDFVICSTFCVEFPWLIADSELVPEENELFLLLGLSSSNSSMHVLYCVSKNSSEFFQTIVCLGILSSSDWVFLYSWLPFIFLGAEWSFDSVSVIWVSTLVTMPEHYKTKTKHENKHFYVWWFKNKLSHLKHLIQKCKHSTDCKLSESSEETPKHSFIIQTTRNSRCST